MTHVISVPNVNIALPTGIAYLKEHGIREDSRNGAVLVAPGPVITEYQYPMERVLMDAMRDANPFFHLLESLWMLAGRNDVKFPAHYAANIASFSDDGVTVAGAYGDRWINRFGYNQLPVIIAELRHNPKSRRCVLTMWDAYGSDSQANVSFPADLTLAMNGGKDVPCNTHVYFDTTGGVLNMTVCCRSNDMVWGAYGANAVHFSFLHEYVARAAGMVQGVYRQFSNNFHAYIERPDTVKLFEEDMSEIGNPYDITGCGGTSYPLISTDVDTWDTGLELFFSTWDSGDFERMKKLNFRDPFFPDVVVPLVMAHKFFKEKRWEEAMDSAVDCQAWDWSLNATQWIKRRQIKSEATK